MAANDAFTAGVRPGGLTNSTEIRLLLCYLVKNAGPITRTEIENALMEEALVNYFEIGSCLDDITRQSLVTLQNDRYAITEKGRRDGAACESSLDFEELLSHCSTPEKAAEYIAATDYGFLAESLGESFTAFEKQCDNEIVSRLENAKYATFGPDPLIAYYYAKQAEAKNVRIILSAKASGVPAEIISERVRDIYV